MVSIVFALVIAVAVSCGEREGGEGDDGGGGGGGGNVNPGPISTVVCAANCSAAAACSGHGGVNCPAGPDTDGSVICSDGYKDSSIKYQCQ